jgi:hypothetical protein
MNIGDQDYERAMVAIERLVAEVGPRRPTITKRTAATRRQRAILDVIAASSHDERKPQGDWGRGGFRPQERESTMDVICREIDAQAGRVELIDHLALRHIVTLQQLELADESITRIIGLPLNVLRRVHATCVQREDPSWPFSTGGSINAEQAGE